MYVHGVCLSQHTAPSSKISGISRPLWTGAGFAGMIPPCGLEPTDLCDQPHHSKQETRRGKNSSTHMPAAHPGQPSSPRDSHTQGEERA